MHLQLPGDKSISHRALILAALAEGTSRLVNLSQGADVDSTLRCLEQCGVSIRTEGEVVVVEGRGGDFQTPDGDLNAGNSGTTARLLAGLLAGGGIHARLTGDSSLSRRPMKRIAEPLQQMGASLQLSPEGTLPLELRPARLQSLTYTLPVASAQVKSALLLAALAGDVPVTIIEPAPSRDHTELMLQTLGVDVQVSGNRISLKPGERAIPPFEIELPGDSSSAAFPAALAVLLPGTELTFDNLLLNPTRLGFFRTLRRMGARVAWSTERVAMGEQVGRLTVQSAPLKGITISGAEIPALIDELPILAVLASQADGTTEVRDAGELRVKESDRIRAVCENLGRMGVSVKEFPDGFRIQGPAPLKAAAVTTYGDHRIAMAFTIAGCMADGTTKLDDPDCVEVSFPGFFDLIGQVVS